MCKFFRIADQVQRLSYQQMSKKSNFFRAGWAGDVGEHIRLSQLLEKLRLISFFRILPYQGIKTMSIFTHQNSPAIISDAVENDLRSVAANLVEQLTQMLLGGLDLSRLGSQRTDQILIAVTEQHTKDDLDRLVEAFERL